MSNPSSAVQQAIVIVDHGSRRAESNAQLEELARLFAAATEWEIVEPAHMELAEPSIATAYQRCVERGAKRIVVFPYFLAPGRHWKQDIPALVAAAGELHPGTEYLVTAPLGLHEMMFRIMNDRIQHCLSHARNEVEPCRICADEERGCGFLS